MMSSPQISVGEMLYESGYDLVMTWLHFSVGNFSQAFGPPKKNAPKTLLIHFSRQKNGEKLKQ